MITTDERPASPNGTPKDCLARLSEMFEHAENVARTVSNRFGATVTEDAYKQIHFKLVKAGRRKGWRAVPLATIKQIIDLYTANITIAPPDPNEASGDETQQNNLEVLWERAKLWGAPRDCGGLQRLLSTIEKELPDNMKPIIR